MGLLNLQDLLTHSSTDFKNIFKIQQKYLNNFILKGILWNVLSKPFQHELSRLAFECVNLLLDLVDWSDERSLFHLDQNELIVIYFNFTIYLLFFRLCSMDCGILIFKSDFNVFNH